MRGWDLDEAGPGLSHTKAHFHARTSAVTGYTVQYDTLAYI